MIDAPTTSVPCGWIATVWRPPRVVNERDLRLETNEWTARESGRFAMYKNSSDDSAIGQSVFGLKYDDDFRALRFVGRQAR